MAKFAAVLIAAFAFQAAVAGTTEDVGNPLLRTLQTLQNDTVSAIEDVQPDQHRGRRALAEAANEYAHNIQVIVYDLHQLIFHNQYTRTHEVVTSGARRLSDFGHYIQQAVRDEPDQLKNALTKYIIPSVVGEADKLLRAASEQYQAVKEGHANVSQELEDAVNALLDATRQLKIRGEIQELTRQQVKERVQEITNDITSDIQKITAHDEKTLHVLVHEVHQLSRRVSADAIRIQKEIYHQKGETKNALRQVVIKFEDSHTFLEALANDDQGTPEARVTELKQHLKSSVHNTAAQVERLIQLSETVNQDSNDGQGVINLVKNIVARSLSASHHLHKQLEGLAGTHEEN